MSHKASRFKIHGLYKDFSMTKTRLKNNQSKLEPLNAKCNDCGYNYTSKNFI